MALRAVRDFKRMSGDPPAGVSGAPCADNIMVWNAVIFGPGAYPSYILEAGSAGSETAERPAGAALPVGDYVAKSGRRPRRRAVLGVPPCRDTQTRKLTALFSFRISADTPFEDGTFRLVLTFDESYPNKPPVVKFISKMFHPNVYANGELCLDILQNRWSPTYDVAAILTSIQSLLHDPNPNRSVPRPCMHAEQGASRDIAGQADEHRTRSPANVEAATLYRDNNRDYVKRVRQTVEQSWVDDDIPA